MATKRKNTGPPHPPEPDLTERTFRVIVRNAHMIRQVMEPFFNGFGLTVATWVTVRVLSRQQERTGKPVRLVDLSKILCIRQPTLTSSVNKLELLGYVQRIESPENRRDRLVRVTPKGRRLIKRVMVVHREKIQGLLQVWSPAEKQQVLVLLEKLAGHLESAMRSSEPSDVPNIVP